MYYKSFHETLMSPQLLYILLLAAGPGDVFLGRWDLTVTAGETRHASWLEVTRDADALKGRFVGRSGSVRPAEVTLAGDEIRFAPRPAGRPKPDLPPEAYRARLAGGKLEGSGANNRGEAVTFVGVKLVRPPAPQRPPRWGAPITLFNGRDLDGWDFRSPRGRECWSVASGEIVNQTPCPDLLTRQKFRDFQLHIEYNLDPGSNSGVYLRGRYEVQIDDAGPRELEPYGVGAIYGFLAPAVKAAKPAGEWQAFDITFVGYHVTVALNGKTLIDNKEIDGITGAALDAEESEPGPILLQGDHGRVRFRNIVIRPAR